MLIDTLTEIFEKNGMKSKWVEEGLEEGREREREIIAKNLLAKGSTPEFVQEITGLDAETILRFDAQSTT